MDTSVGVGFVCGGGYLQSKLHLFYFWQLNGRLNRHIGFNVIFAAVIMIFCFVFHDVIILFVYMLICLHRGPQGRIAITAKRVTLLKHCINKKKDK